MVSSEAADANRAQRQALIDAGLLVATGAEGVYGRSGEFERVVLGIESLVAEVGAALGARTVRFPPVLARATLLATDYLASFPSLAGDVASFSGDDRAHAELLGRVEAGRGWADLMAPTDVVLCPAACHPLYPTLPPDVTAEGSYFDVYGYVFRHEPSVDPARMVSFRQYELVYVGSPEGASDHRDRSLRTALEMITSLGVDATSTVANDPFFGRAGRMLARNQREEQLKFEVLAPTSGAAAPTAIASANCHEDHFGRAFGLRLPGGEPAHTACVGYGVERITLALVWAHGTDLEAWPGAVRERLGL